MKVSPSSPPPNPNPSPPNPKGCLSAVLRRVLCGTTTNNNNKKKPIKTDPTPTTTTTHKDQTVDDDKGSPSSPVSAAPNIVARLMGLDPMPVYSPLSPPRLGRRSRSANSVDWHALLLVPSSQFASSASFREVPTYLRRENDEFLLLSFEKVEEKAKDDSKRDQEKMKRRDGGGRAKEARFERRRRRKKRRKRRIELVKNCSENSSPVSVLEQLIESDSEELIELEIRVSEGRAGSPKKKFGDPVDCPPATVHRSSVHAEREDKVGLWGMVCGMVTEEVKMLNWGQEMGRSEDLEIELGSMILENLLMEVTDELLLMRRRDCWNTCFL
ncbi:hypothetical protein QJS10_CPA03g01226 [Acorus calamus]|uniref:DUF3741 domain-containing protein n=1 Tax=Acorus calamus TaxID=4465 RepID=A0AAV9F6V8_ACOCL|nr:hypothetical protein QJS10_CPA03g01226 [Acorus calamus]